MTKSRTAHIRIFNEDKEWFRITTKALGIKHPELMNKIIRSPNLDLNEKIKEEIKKKIKKDEEVIRRWS